MEQTLRSKEEIWWISLEGKETMELIEKYKPLHKEGLSIYSIYEAEHPQDTVLETPKNYVGVRFYSKESNMVYTIEHQSKIDGRIIIDHFGTYLIDSFEKNIADGTWVIVDKPNSEILLKESNKIPTDNFEVEHTEQPNILKEFIEAIKSEFKDENWEYLDFIADRVLTKSNSEFSPIEPKLYTQEEVDVMLDKQACETTKQVLSNSKLYSEDDMKTMFECGRNFQLNGEITLKESFDYIKSQTKTN